jgi:competence protein ComEC
MNRRRLFYYVLLNIFVSAAVTGAILFFYDRSHRTAPAALLAAPTPTGSTAAGPAAGEVKAGIVSVIGAGMTASEIVVVQNDGTGSLVLTGWTLKDSQGNTYTFPQLTLYPGGTLQVHTAAGQDTAVDLYWGRSGPAWSPGELAALYDAGGVARAFYRIP